jgi:hypothetical protein
MTDRDKIMAGIIKSATLEGMPYTFRLCRDDRKYKDVLFSDAENLKSLVRAGMSEHVIMSRKDLKTITQWTNFCQAIANGFSYAYAIDPHSEPPFMVKTYHDFPPKQDRLGFDLLGLMPESGAEGWIFTMTSTRQQPGVPDITSHAQDVYIEEIALDYVLARYVEFIVSSSYERGIVQLVSIQNAALHIDDTRPYTGQNDDDLKSLLTELVTKVKIEVLCKSTLTFTTDRHETWSFVIKAYEIEF